MDTRSKIVSLEEAAARASGTGTTVLLSHFDVLTAERVRQVKTLALDAGLMIAVISEVPGSLLPVAARAELAASLAMVDLVVITEEPLAHFPAARFVDDREMDSARTTRLTEHVQQRSREAGE